MEPNNKIIVGTTTIKPSYRSLRALYLGAVFMRDAKLKPGKRYAMAIQGLDDLEIEGTLDKGSTISGLAPLYNSFNLKDGDQISLRWDGAILQILPPLQAAPVSVPIATAIGQTVFDQKTLKHIHIEYFAPGNLTRWNPHTEPDIYMALGVLSEYTDFRYCCGASKALLEKLGYFSETKPDAVLIDRTTNAYLMAEFKMRSREFSLNHDTDDVDVLVCWIDDETDRSKLPSRVLSLKLVLERVIAEGDIEL